MNYESMPVLILASLLSAGVAWFLGLHGKDILIQIIRIVFDIS